jgi:CBS domain-containing protein
MPTKIPDQLKEVASQVSQGGERSETVRTLLSWFDSERRGYWVVHEVRKALRKVRVKTVPDFEEAWIDAPITFLAKPKKEKGSPAGESEPVPETTAESLETENEAPIPAKHADGVHSRIKVGVLAAANTPPLCISPDADVSEAITLMLQHDYSQLPVTTTVRDVKGLISWRSLGSRLALGKQCKKVRECMETANEMRSDASLFDAIQQIVEHECVLVRDASRKVTGIVSTADLGMQFAQLGEPFLLLGQIENNVRNLMANKFTKTELAAVRDPADSDREIEDVSDLTFGEYVRLLQNPKHWATFAIQIDRKTFTDELRKVGEIRNDVMHFHPDGVVPEDLTRLRKFARFLGELEKKLAS